MFLVLFLVAVFSFSLIFLCNLGVIIIISCSNSISSMIIYLLINFKPYACWKMTDFLIE